MKTAVSRLPFFFLTPFYIAWRYRTLGPSFRLAR
jgi:hypothetical protein